MEKLTRIHYGARAEHYLKCSEKCEMDDCSAECSHFDDVVERLAAYEDTERMPEEVQALNRLFDYALKESRTLQEQLALIERLRELADADKDGRLVAVPEGKAALPVTEKELGHLINDVIAYMERLENRSATAAIFGYESRKELLEKLKKFEKDNFPGVGCIKEPEVSNDEKRNFGSR